MTFILIYRQIPLLLDGKWEQVVWVILQKRNGSKHWKLLGKANSHHFYPHSMLTHTKSVTTPTDFKAVLHDWEMQVSQDPIQFKQLYLFTFNYVKSKGQKSMEVEVSYEINSVLNDIFLI